MSERQTDERYGSISLDDLVIKTDISTESNVSRSFSGSGMGWARRELSPPFINQSSFSINPPCHSEASEI